MITEAEEVKRPVPYPGTEGAPTDGPHDMNHMIRISALIADMQGILDRFGDTCVYIRRGGLSWGAVALNRQSDDEKFGLFDIQAQHDRDMKQRAEQVERLRQRITEIEGWRCFHCGEVFNSSDAARDHFGASIDATPVCQIPDLAHLLRLQEYELRRYREEDSAMARQFHSLGAEHHRKLQDEEEKGYARGLADGRGLTAELVKQVRLLVENVGGPGSKGYHAEKSYAAQTAVVRLLKDFPD